MAIKFSKITPGMTLIDARKTRMGNTTMREWSWWRVQIVSVDDATQTARVRWNGNAEEMWPRHRLERLYRTLPKACRDQVKR